MSEIRFVDNRTAEDHDRDFLPGMGKPWLMPFYDLFSRLAGVRRLHERAVQLAGIGPAQQVLDIGGGTGNLSFAVLRSVPDAQVTVLDPDRHALQRAGRKAARRRVSLTLVQGYADRLPADDAEVDQVISALALHHVDDAGRTAFAREAYRVLRPGGKITILDFGGPGPDRGTDDHGHAHDHDHQHRHGIAALSAKQTTRNRQFARNLGNSLVELLTAGGFEDVREVDHLDHRFGPITVVQATR